MQEICFTEKEDIGSSESKPVFGALLHMPCEIAFADPTLFEIDFSFRESNPLNYMCK